MPIDIRDDVVYIMLKKIDECDRGPGPDEVKFTDADFAGIQVTPTDLLGHVDYLNQRNYINAEFSGNAYGNQEDVPDAVHPKEFDLRIANSYGASDGPLPHLIEFKKAELTEKGRKMLEEMNAKPPQNIQSGPTVPIPDVHMPFLKKVMVKGKLSDLYDARDITEVVFRTMRDMMTNEAADRVESELHEPMEPTDEKALQNEVADLWHDTNPLVRFLSRVRPPLIIKEDTFLFRIQQESTLPPNTEVATVVKSVFSATKADLSEDRIQEVAGFLPGKIRQMWEEA